MTTSFQSAADTSNSRGVAVTPGNNTKGSPVELISSLSFNAKALWLLMAQEGLDSQDVAIDIMTGAAASEVARIVNLPWCQRIRMPMFYGPIPVDPAVFASGTRVSAQAERVNASGSDMWIAPIFADAYPSIPASSLVYDMGGVTLGGTDKFQDYDPGATANTVGSWVELDAAVPSDAELIWLFIGNDDNFATGGLSWLINLGVGGGGAESAVISNIFIGDQDTSDLIQPKSIGPFPADPWKGGRLSVQAQCSGNDATDRVFDVTSLVVSGTVPSSGGGGGLLVHPGMTGGMRG